MNANEFMRQLISLGACQDAKEWAEGKSWQEVYNTCHYGDWLLWLYHRSKRYDFQKIMLAKGLCANTVRHLMKDERSLKAVDAAIAFGKGEISREDLNAAAAAAAYAYVAANAVANAADAAYPAYAAAYAAKAAAATNAVATVAVINAAADAAAYAATGAYSAAARKENQQKTADIVREVLPFDIWEL